ncbi:hypothetical protein EF847_05425 [Actinobacteria bacterium YIM 96077]|uniref:Uncharacterized protein n=1 Tax=Phytoactinopolyspora halophila TaxID=1981511 RepID=A0A329R369_9ACTN|nr:hypothetical protein [Phytoactinopolyspora halophila]AYY12231.1 hypothetical protein EF847_05425 [Actinobacteria bacterium YIM 96077]RAW18536.1 hypothetical protein DPM12_00090 [Phytoactinopolyspora halophila]
MAGKTHDSLGEDPVKQAGSLEKPESDDVADMPDYSSTSTGSSGSSGYSGGYGGGRSHGGVDRDDQTSGDETDDNEDTDGNEDDGEESDKLRADSDDDSGDDSGDDSTDDSGDDAGEDTDDSDDGSGDDGSGGGSGDDRRGGGRVSIDIQAMTTLIAAMERARDQIPEYQAEFRKILTDAGLDEVDVPGKEKLSQVVAWIEDELPHLRRRLALAQALEDRAGSGDRKHILPGGPPSRPPDGHILPGEAPRQRGPVVYDESKIPDDPPHVSRDNGRECASQLGTDADQSQVNDLIERLKGNQHDPYFAHGFTNEADASNVTALIESARSDGDPARANELEQLVTETVQTAGRGTGDVAPSDGFEDQWGQFTSAGQPSGAPA